LVPALSDPLVERRRRQFLLAWGAWLAGLILVTPITFIIFANLPNG
jgi:hypothetical protein